MATQAQLSAARAIVKECGIAITDFTLSKLVDAVQPSGAVFDVTEEEWRLLQWDRERRADGEASLDVLNTILAKRQPAAVEPGTPRPGAPRDVAGLPDWWDEQRRIAGKDASTCAAELRLALGEHGARVELPTREEIARGLFEANACGPGDLEWEDVVGQWPLESPYFKMADYVLSLLRDRVRAPGQAGIELNNARMWRLKHQEADAELTTLREQLAREQGDLAEWAAATGCVTPREGRFMRENLTDALEAERKAHGETRAELESARGLDFSAIAEHHANAANRAEQALAKLRERVESLTAELSEWAAATTCATPREVRFQRENLNDAAESWQGRAEAAEARLRELRRGVDIAITACGSLDMLKEEGWIALAGELSGLAKAALTRTAVPPVAEDRFDYAPKQVAVLPDWWDARRAQQGKDRSRCAAELRVALAAEPAQPKPDMYRESGEPPRVRLAHDLPTPPKLTPEQMEACTREATVAHRSACAVHWENASPTDRLRPNDRHAQRPVGERRTSTEQVGGMKVTTVHLSDEEKAGLCTSGARLPSFAVEDKDPRSGGTYTKQPNPAPAQPAIEALAKRMGRLEAAVQALCDASYFNDDYRRAGALKALGTEGE